MILKCTPAEYTNPHPSCLTKYAKMELYRIDTQGIYYVNTNGLMEKDLSARYLAISQYPLFALLTEEHKQSLAKLFHDLHLNENSIITKEGEIVDKIYFIISGTAVVKKEISNIEGTKEITVASLQDGDAIGLGETGFYSHRGVRTATVTASTEMDLIAIDIKTFNNFLQGPEITYPALRNDGEKILLMNFLQQSQLTNKLALEDILIIANNVEKVYLAENQTLYKRGDLANACYYLIKGRIQLIADDIAKAEIIDQYTIINEAEFINHMQYGSTAVAQCEAALLKINRNTLDSLSKKTKLSLIDRLTKNIKNILRFK